MKKPTTALLLAVCAFCLTAAVQTKDINKGKQVPPGTELKPNEYT